MQSGEKLAIVCVIALVCVLFVSQIMIPRIIRETRETRELAHHQNVKQISLAMLTYATNNAGCYPSSLADLYPKYISHKEAFINPLSGESPGEISEIHKWSDFIILPGRKKTDPSHTLLGYVKPTENSDYTVMLYVDGHLVVSIRQESREEWLIPSMRPKKETEQ